MKIKGTVTYQALGTGFWGIETANGEQYRPDQLPAQYQQEGLKVEIDAEEQAGQMSVFMWGTAIKIKTIKKLAK